MPSAKVCNKIKDPKKRAQCKSYSGPYANMGMKKGGTRDIDNNGKRKSNGSKTMTARSKSGY
tara:strand:- start:230 stop:415 length:186 start_codon:yes stop_codon:yes gene_type:complete